MTNCACSNCMRDSKIEWKVTGGDTLCGLLHAMPRGETAPVTLCKSSATCVSRAFKTSCWENYIVQQHIYPSKHNIRYFIKTKCLATKVHSREHRRNLLLFIPEEVKVLNYMYIYILACFKKSICTNNKKRNREKKLTKIRSDATYLYLKYKTHLF